MTTQTDINLVCVRNYLPMLPFINVGDEPQIHVFS